MATTTAATAAPPPKRMSLDKLIRGKQAHPLKVLLFGVEGIGKSTFAASAPAPIFIGAEDGTKHLDVARFPAVESWPEIMDAVRTLTSEPSEFKTLVIDTIDFAEPMLWDAICKRDGQKSIEEYGYGKGYTAALDEWRRLLAALEQLQRAKGMHIVLLGHSAVKSFKNPEGSDFDRYELTLNAKAGGLLKGWCDCVLFANYETFATEDKKTKRVKGTSLGTRLIYTERAAAFDAKNRYALPASLPLSWDEFLAAVAAHRPADPVALLADLNAKLSLVPAEKLEAVKAAIAAAGQDAAKLAVVLSRVDATIQ